MEVRIQAAHGPVDVSVGERDLSFRVAGRDVAIPWVRSWEPAWLVGKTFPDFPRAIGSSYPVAGLRPST